MGKNLDELLEIPEGEEGQRREDYIETVAKSITEIASKAKEVRESRQGDYTVRCIEALKDTWSELGGAAAKQIHEGIEALVDEILESSGPKNGLATLRDAYLDKLGGVKGERIYAEYVIEKHLEELEKEAKPGEEVERREIEQGLDDFMYAVLGKETSLSGALQLLSNIGKGDGSDVSDFRKAVMDKIRDKVETMLLEKAPLSDLTQLMGECAGMESDRYTAALAAGEICEREETLDRYGIESMSELLLNTSMAAKKFRDPATARTVDRALKAVSEASVRTLDIGSVDLDKRSAVNILLAFSLCKDLDDRPAAVDKLREIASNFDNSIAFAGAMEENISPVEKGAEANYVKAGLLADELKSMVAGGKHFDAQEARYVMEKTLSSLGKLPRDVGDADIAEKLGDLAEHVAKEVAREEGLSGLSELLSVAKESMQEGSVVTLDKARAIKCLIDVTQAAVEENTKDDDVSKVASHEIKRKIETIKESVEKGIENAYSQDIKSAGTFVTTFDKLPSRITRPIQQKYVGKAVEEAGKVLDRLKYAVREYGWALPEKRVEEIQELNDSLESTISKAQRKLPRPSGLDRDDSTPDPEEISGDLEVVSEEKSRGASR